MSTPVIEAPRLAETEARELDIEARAVRKVYPGGSVGLEQVSLAVERGAFFSLLGPSGCGKSTLLRILSGLEVPTEGSVWVRGTDVTRVPSHRRPTNMVFQRLALFPHLSVAKNIAYGPRVNGRSPRETREIVAESLELVGLGAFADRLPHQLSGGQQQRVAIARALANRPAVLLLDEPLSALDLKLRVQMQHTLKRIQRESGTTFVYVTHDQGEAFTMSDRMAVMNNGRIEQIGRPIDVYERPSTLFTATFLGETNVFRGDRAGDRIHADGLDIVLPEPGSTVSVRPEHMMLAPELPNSVENTFAGVVADITFHGSITRYVVAAAAARLVVERSSNAEFRPQPGDAVSVGWRASSGIVISDEPAPEK
ncbi:MAG TPA: ABC transporter ATP-binding protein [Gryllotalpicola sp.]